MGQFRETDKPIFEKITIFSLKNKSFQRLEIISKMSKRKFSDSVTTLISTRHPKNDDSFINNWVGHRTGTIERRATFSRVLDELKFPLELQGIMGGYFGHQDFLLGVWPFNEHFSTCSQLCKANLTKEGEVDWFELPNSLPVWPL